MYRSESEDSLELEMDALEKELQKKEEDLLLAARCGKSLLDENVRLNGELQELAVQQNNLLQMLESQKTDALHTQSEIRHTAETHMAELEERLDNLEQSLSQERAATSLVKEEHRKVIEGLEMDIAQLQEKLVKAAEPHVDDEQLQVELKQKLEACEEEKREFVLEISALKAQLTAFQENKKVVREQTSTLAHTCDKFLDELENAKEEVEFWEKQCLAKDTELQSQFKELSDCQALGRQLQLQLNQQTAMALTPNSTLLGISLFDELSATDSSTSQEDLSFHSSTDDMSGSTCFNRYEEIIPEMLQKPSDRQQTELEVSPETVVERDSCTQAWLEDDQCPRCQRLNEELQKQRVELEFVNKLLMKVVQQKFELQQQNEAWQNDMATMVQKQVSKQLEREVLTRRTRQTGAVLKDRSSKKKYTLSRILLH